MQRVLWEVIPGNAVREWRVSQRRARTYKNAAMGRCLLGQPKLTLLGTLRDQGNERSVVSLGARKLFVTMTPISGGGLSICFCLMVCLSDLTAFVPSKFNIHSLREHPFIQSFKCLKPKLPGGQQSSSFRDAEPGPSHRQDSSPLFFHSPSPQTGFLHMSETRPQAPSFKSLRSNPPGQNGSEVLFVLSLKAWRGDSGLAWSGAHTCTSGRHQLHRGRAPGEKQWVLVRPLQ